MIEMSKQFDCSKHMNTFFVEDRESINRQNLGMVVGFGG